MAQDQHSPIVDLLKAVLPASLIEYWAERLDVVKRQRKVDVVVLVWTLVLGFPAGAKRTLEALRRSFQQASGTTLARSSFHGRLTPALSRLLRELATFMLQKRTDDVCGQLREAFAGFEELLAVDSTVLRLHELLRGVYPACNDGQAGCKLHTVINVVSGKPNQIQLTDATTHDQGPWKRVGGWLKGCLLLCDLGYYNFHLFHRIDRQGGWFLTRVKVDANPLITRSNVSCPGRSKTLAGHTLQEVLGGLKRKIIDVEVELPVRLRKYRGRQRTIRRRFRLVGIRNDESGDYHMYLTNLAPDRLSATELAKTYALRWQVELLFKQLRSYGRLHQLPSTQKHIVEALIWASVIALLVSHALLRLARATIKRHQVPALRFQEVFRTHARTLLDQVCADRRDGRLDVWELMLREAADPNLERERAHDILRPEPLAA